MEKKSSGATLKFFMYALPLFFFLTSLVLLLNVYPQITAGKIFEYRSFPLMGMFEIHFLVDRLSLGFGVLVSSIYLLVTIYSISYIQTHRLKYYLLLMLNLLSMLGLTFSCDLMGFYIFFETVSISAYFLIIHSRGKEALDAGYKYIVMMLVGGLFILTAMMLLFISSRDGDSMGHLIGICFAIGCLLKAGAFPFHTWLPEAHPAAPSPISALLSGVMIKVGAYGLVRAFFYPDFLGGTSETTSQFFFESLRNLSESASVKPLVLLLGIFSMLIGVSLALLQKDLKRLLAYHSVSQIGYILLGISMGKYGLAGGLLHIMSHAIFKGLLFLAIGAVIFRTGIRKIDKLGGLWRKMPITTFTCMIAALSISGVPLTSGYASKGILFEGVKGNHLLEIIFIATAAGTCASFLKLIRHTFFGQLNSTRSDVKEVSGFMTIPMLFLALGSILLGLFPAFVLKVLLGSFAPEPHLWTLPHLLEALLSLGLGIALYTILLRIGVFGLEHHEEAKPVASSIPDKGHILKYCSVDRLYTSIARGIYVFGVQLEKIHHRSIGGYIQLVVSFLVVVIVVYLLKVI